MLDAVAAPRLLHQAHHLLHRARRVVFKAERECEVEQQLRVRRSFNGCVQRRIYGECELSLDLREVAHQAVVHPQPSAVAERVAVGLLDSCPGRRADVREEERRGDVAGDLAQVAVVPGRLDAPEDRRCIGVCVVPADAEAVAVGGLDSEAGVETLVYEGMGGLVEQLLEEDRGSRVSEPAAHRLLLSTLAGQPPTNRSLRTSGVGGTLRSSTETIHRPCTPGIWFRWE